MGWTRSILWGVSLAARVSLNNLFLLHQIIYGYTILYKLDIFCKLFTADLPFTQTLEGSIMKTSEHVCFRTCGTTQTPTVQHDRCIHTHILSSLLLCARVSHRVDDAFEGMKPRQNGKDVFCAVCYFSELQQSVLNVNFYDKPLILSSLWKVFAGFGHMLQQHLGRKCLFTGDKSIELLELSSPGLMIVAQEAHLALFN